ncbi:hypothetical protein T08_16338 [Trichinella sp. T8]|nr:hypothetical protein T08_16338 [Trichinella sp. T8]
MMDRLKMGMPGVSNELDNPTYETTTVIQKLE